MSNYYFFFIFQTKLCFEVSTTNLLVPECMTISLPNTSLQCTTPRVLIKWSA